MTISVRPGPASGRVLASTARWSRTAAAVVAGIGLSVVPAPAAASVVVLTISGIGLMAGLPHGSVDHTLTSSLSGRPVWLVTGSYAATAVLAYVLLSTTGPIGWGVIVVLSVAHFGAGEVQMLRALTDWRPGRIATAATAVAGTGALLLPLARSGNQLRAVAAALSPGLADVLGADPLRLSITAVWVLAAIIAVTAVVRARRPVIAVDLALVGALGAFAPPLMAFAVWFGAWHSLRHTGRLLTLEPRCAALLAIDEPRKALAALARQALWPTTVAVTVLAALTALTANAPDPVAALAQTLRVLLALTVPHMLIVTWLDRQPAAAAVPDHPTSR